MTDNEISRVVVRAYCAGSHSGPAMQQDEQPFLSLCGFAPWRLCVKVISAKVSIRPVPEKAPDAIQAARGEQGADRQFQPSKSQRKGAKPQRRKEEAGGVG